MSNTILVCNVSPPSGGFPSGLYWTTEFFFYVIGTNNPWSYESSSTILTTLPSDPFPPAYQLQSVTIGDVVTTIGDTAFQNCTTLTGVTFNQPSQPLTIGDNAFNGCTALQSIIIPDTVTSIGISAFQVCNALNTVTISQSSSSLLTIGDYAFSQCPFTSITIPDSILTIGPNAFQFSGLNINGPSGAVTIDQQKAINNNLPGFSIATPPTPQDFFGATNVNLSLTCYEANTLILILENNEEVYKKVSKLKVGDLVKTYKKGYKKIKLLHSFKYKPPSGIKGLNMLYKHKENGVIITGGHSILVDELTEQEKINNLKQCGFNKTIEDKKLLLACSSDKFKKIDDCCKEYQLYHFSLETDDPKEHFGVYITDGILSESCPKDALLKMVSKRAIIKNVVRKMH